MDIFALKIYENPYIALFILWNTLPNAFEFWFPKNGYSFCLFVFDTINIFALAW